jgi:hypothetical protein
VQRRSDPPVSVGPNDNLDVLVEGNKETHQPFDRELAEFPAHHLRNIRLLHTEQACSLGLREAAARYDRLDFKDQLRFDEVFLRVWNADVLEHVRLANFIPFPAHAHPSSPASSKAILSASRKRLVIGSMSALDVFRPVFDFF